MNQNSDNFNYQINNETSNKNMMKFIIIFLAVLIVVGIIIFVISLNSKKSSTFNMGEDIEIKSDFVNIYLKVEDIERNVQVPATIGEDEIFTKIKLAIKNNRKDDEFNGSFIEYELLDENKNEIDGSSCSGEMFMGFFDVDDAMPMTISADSTSSGYLYCKDEKNLGSVLRVVSYTAFDEELIEQGTIKSTDYDMFYVSLK